MIDPTAPGAFAGAFVTALRRLGLRHACISPGARNTSLSLALVRSGVTTWVHHDERSSAFFALGLARATAAPVALACTSGTAAAEYLPALVEGRASRVPLVVLTADRPPELRDVGAPQSIDQVKMYGDAVKWFHDVGVVDVASVTAAPHLAAHVWTLAEDVPAGPVHVNFPFREPLDVETETEGLGAPPTTMRGPIIPGEAELTEVTSMITGKKVLVVAGAVEDEVFAPTVADLAARLQAPVHADPLSGLRHGAHDRTQIISGSDLLVAAGWLDMARPDVVLRFGAVPTSKALWSWLEARPDVPQIVVDAAGWRDPTRSARLVVRGDPHAVAEGLAKMAVAGPAGWWEEWRAARTAASAVVDEVLAGGGRLSEPAIARLLTATSQGILGVASSMPIRDVDAFGVTTSAALRYVANRGANGIDGTISMTLGALAGAASPGRLLIGDVAALHDLTALRTAARLRIPLTTVVVHNDGGGIFHFLPHADLVDSEEFERVFGTPHGTDFVAIAAAMEVASARVGSSTELVDALEHLEPPALIEVTTDREENLALHRGVVVGVAGALARL